MADMDGSGDPGGHPGSLSAKHTQTPQQGRRLAGKAHAPAIWDPGRFRVSIPKGRICSPGWVWPRDALYLAVLLALTAVFYLPEADPLASRYMYYADNFERAAAYLNPAYNNEYIRYAWECYAPMWVILSPERIARLFGQPGGHGVLALSVGTHGRGRRSITWPTAFSSRPWRPSI